LSQSVSAMAVGMQLDTLPRPLKIVLQPTTMSRSTESLDANSAEVGSGLYKGIVKPDKKGIFIIQGNVNSFFFF